MSKEKDFSTKELMLYARKLIDDGLNNLGENKNDSLLDKYIYAATIKSLRFHNAIVILCERNLTDEALVLLRSLIENTINMRWILQKPESRLKEYILGDGKSFGASWTSVKFDKRLEDVGFKNRDYFDFLVKVTYSYAHVNASSLVWDESKARFHPNAVYIATAQILGHLLKALDTHFPGQFKGCDNIWNQISGDRDIRRKIAEIRKQFEAE